MRVYLFALVFFSLCIPAKADVKFTEVYIWDRVIDVDEMSLAMKTIGGLAVQPGGKLATTWGNIKRR